MIERCGMASVHRKHAVFATKRMVFVRYLAQQLLERPARVCSFTHSGCIWMRASTVLTNDDIGCIALIDQELVKAEPLLFTAAEI